MNPETIMETTKECSKAASKLGGIIEKIFGPRWTKKQADADEYADQKKIDIIRKNPDMNISYADGKLYVSRCDESFLQRAEQRRDFNAIRQEKNIESVIEMTAEDIKNSTEVSDESVDSTWIYRFFDAVKDVDSEDIQRIWSKILSKEIASPNSTSLRTLETLRNMSTKEAHSFEKIMPYVINFGGDTCLVSSDLELMRSFNITTEDYFLLDWCGLIQMVPFCNVSDMVDSKDQRRNLWTNDRLLLITNKTDGNIKLQIDNIYLLTMAGKELFNILYSEPDNEFFIKWAEWLHSANSSLRFEILQRSENRDKLTYDSNPIIIFEEK